MIRVFSYKGMSSEFTLGFDRGGVPIPLVSAGTSRVRLVNSQYDVDSDTVGFGSGQAIDVTTEGEEGNIIFKLGDISDPDMPAGIHNMQVVLYDPLHPNGQPFEDLVQLRLPAGL